VLQVHQVDIPVAVHLHAVAVAHLFPEEAKRADNIDNMRGEAVA
jgi:hypothetical protein